MGGNAPLYLDTSAVLRATLEAGLARELGDRIEASPLLITSRLSLVEAARAFHRIRAGAEVDEDRLGRVIRAVESLWARCEIWEITPRVCERASLVRPETGLRTLDALHLATYLMARERIEGLRLLTADRRLEEAAAGL